MVSRNAVSLLFRLPLESLPKIQAVPGVARVAYSYWFEGIYIDKKHFFPQFATSMPAALDCFPEFIIPPEQKLAVIADRRGAGARRKTGGRHRGGAGGR